MDPAAGADADWSCCARRRRIATRRCRSSSAATVQTLARAGDRSSLRLARSAPRPARHAQHRHASVASTTPLNQSIGPHRRFDWLAMDLDDVKAREESPRRHAQRRRARHRRRRGASLPRAAARVDLRDARLPGDGAGQRAHARPSVAALGNRVSGWMVPMPLGERDPRRRLENDPRDHRAAEGIEAGSRGRGAHPGRRVDAVDVAVARRAPGDATRCPSTWSSPTFPARRCRSTCSARACVDNYGLVPLTDDLCLGIVLFSYAGKLCWGFTAEWDLLPDLHDFVLDIEASFRELADLDPAVAKERSNGKRARRAASRAAASPPA